jgi:predicted permease
LDHISHYNYIAASHTVPRKSPLLPAHVVGTVARFGFHVFILSLIYSTIARAVTWDSLNEYWFVVVAAFFVLGVSYTSASLLHYYGGPCLHITNPRDFYALRISATFPNIVALPILIFPTLCEYSVVYEAFGSPADTGATTIDVSELQQSCEDQATTMIFCYFFSWSLAFWSFGHPQLMQAANMKTETVATTTNQSPISIDASAPVASASPDTDTVPEHCKNENDMEDQDSQPASHDDIGDHTAEESSNDRFSFAKVLWNALKQTATSPGFIAMVAGFLTACVPPLQGALFDPGGALRFLGAALEALGQASSPISTIVVAASMVPLPVTPEPPVSREEVVESSCNELHESPQNAQEDQEPAENPIMSDPNFGPYQRRPHPHDQPYRRRLSRAVSASSRRLYQAATRSTPEMRRLHVWFVLSRLVLSPALVVAGILGLDCGTNVLSSVPPLAKLVVIVNASLPGALVVVVLLKSNPDLAETAAAVAKGKCIPYQ